MFSTGFSAKEEPGTLEILMARQARHLAIPLSQRNEPNPIPASPAILKEARQHFADHCATCHANDGSGNTPIGKNVYPKAPDLRLADTQSLSDGELFFVIHNGIRFTGMPAWGKGKPEEDQDSWKLVHFLRRLPTITAEELEEMKRYNPKTEREREEEAAFERFLGGEDVAPPAPAHHH
ncbi:MAG: c-type cytochrome [Nitrospirae bacterium]|nr:MAG: c-type cytochrome [Nitrospirota bacterium]